jgi:hypothetical protein
MVGVARYFYKKNSCNMQFKFTVVVPNLPPCFDGIPRVFSPNFNPVYPRLSGYFLMNGVNPIITKGASPVTGTGCNKIFILTGDYIY